MNPLFYTSAEGKYDLARILKPILGDEAYDMSYEKLQAYAKVNPEYKKLFDYANEYNKNMLFRAGAKNIHQIVDENINQVTLKDGTFNENLEKAKKTLKGTLNDRMRNFEELDLTDPQFKLAFESELLNKDQNGEYTVNTSNLYQTYEDKDGNKKQGINMTKFNQLYK